MHRRLPSQLSRSVLAGASALGLVVAFGTGSAAASVHPAAAHGAGNRAAEALALLKQLKIGQHDTNEAVIGHMTLTSKAPKQVESLNWSGYADTGSSGTYTKLAGSWTEPSAKCTSTTSLAAFWVGIDGYSTNTVEQDGTLIECYGGSPYYYSWWEMYPSNAIQYVGDTVRPGDRISASVVRNGTTYTLKVTDSTTPANSFTKTETCSASRCKDESAEWIAEAPSGSRGIYPLSDFGTWSLSGASVTGSGKSGTISSFPDDELTMVSSGGKVKAQPSALNSAGTAFKVTWKSA